MTLEIPPHYAHVLHSFRLEGDPDPFAITYGVEVSDPPVAADVNGLAGALHVAFYENVIPQMSSQIILQATEIRYQGDALPAPPAIGVFTEDHAGGNTGATVIAPQNVAFLVHKRTALAGRHGRGRLFLPGVPEGSVDNVGNVLAGTLTGFNAALATWRTDIAADVNFVGMVVLHDDASISPTPAPTLVTSISMDPVVATQRRRLRK